LALRVAGDWRMVKQAFLGAFNFLTTFQHLPLLRHVTTHTSEPIGASAPPATATISIIGIIDSCASRLFSTSSTCGLGVEFSPPLILHLKIKLWAAAGVLESWAKHFFPPALITIIIWLLLYPRLDEHEGKTQSVCWTYDLRVFGFWSSGWICCLVNDTHIFIFWVSRWTRI